MTENNNIEQAIKDNAAGPKRAKGDSGEFEQHSLPEQIEADRYLNSKAAMKKRGAGIKITKMAASGAE